MGAVNGSLPNRGSGTRAATKPRVDTATSSERAWPSTRRWPLVGHIPAMIRRGFVEQLEHSWRRCGDCFELRVANLSLKVIVHPDDVEALLLTRRDNYIKGAAYDQFRQLVGDGLVTAEGEPWRAQRRLIQPSFRRETITTLGARMVAQTDAMLDRWDRGFGSGQPFDVHAELMRLALEIIAESLFGLVFGADRAATSTAAFGDAMEVIAGRITAIAVPPRWLPTPGNRRLERAIRELDQVVAGVIAQRRATKVDHDDLLGALLRARDERGQPVPESLLRDEAITMFLAGHETTAVALTWTLWSLGQHPEQLARCVAELDAALGDRPPTVADLPALAYLGQVFHESMRIIPPVWSGARDCVVADTLGDGFAVRPGDRVLNMILLTHKHPEFWPEPERFDPERFTPSAVAGRHKFAYMPFSEGPRKCVGLHFATMEAQLLLARILQRGVFRVAPGFVPEPDYQLTTRPKHGLSICWAPRA